MLSAAKGRGVHGCQDSMRAWSRHLGHPSVAMIETRATGSVKRSVNTTLMATINSTAVGWWMCTRRRHRTCHRDPNVACNGTWRGESGDTPEINLGGSACYGNPGCHGGPIGKYKKGTKKERGIGLDRKEGACKGVEGVMNDEELG